MSTASTLRYVKATALTVAAVAAIPVAFLVLAYLDYQSPNWDPEGDSGAVQGYMVMALATAMAVGYVAVAFPAVARRLQKTQELRARKFIAALAVWLLAASLIAATGASLLVGGMSLVAPLGALLFVMGSVLCLPFAPLWIRLAK